MIATVGQRITDLREDAGLTQEELAYEIGMKRSTLSMIELDKRMPSVETLQLLSEKLNVSAYYLLTGIEDRNHLVCEDTGLSNETINVLIHHNGLDGAIKYMRSAIDILVAHPVVLFQIGAYFNFYNGNLDGTDDVGHYHSLSTDDLDRIERLRILDSLKEIRDELKGEERK